MSFSSDELNYLIYRYLKEAGFDHSAFTFGNESNVSVDRLKINPAEVLPGTLIYVVQKGLQYMELEAVVQDSTEEPIQLLTPHNSTKRKAPSKATTNDTKKRKLDNEKVNPPPPPPPPSNQPQEDSKKLPTQQVVQQHSAAPISRTFKPNINTSQEKSAEKMPPPRKTQPMSTSAHPVGQQQERVPKILATSASKPPIVSHSQTQPISTSAHPISQQQERVPKILATSASKPSQAPLSQTQEKSEPIPKAPPKAILSKTKAPPPRAIHISAVKSHPPESASDTSPTPKRHQSEIQQQLVQNSPTMRRPEPTQFAHTQSPIAKRQLETHHPQTPQIRQPRPETAQTNAAKIRQSDPPQPLSPVSIGKPHQ